MRQIIGLNFPNGQGGYNWISAWDAGVAIKAPPGMHFNQVMSHSVVSDGNAHHIPYLTIGDADGDEAGGYVSGYLKATWYENGAQIPYDWLGNELWGCGGPYKLRVEVWDIQANTPYGVPNNRYYGNSWVEYTVIPHNSSICYLRPNDMGNYGGYDGNIFHNFWGFSRWSGFPTTGFQYAAFTLIGAGADQSRYRCYSHNGGGKIWLSTINGYGANCTVNYASEQKWQFIQNGTPVITMEYFNGRDWIWMDSFTIPVPSKWPAKINQNLLEFTNQLTDDINEPGDRRYWEGGAEHGHWQHIPKTTYKTLDYCRNDDHSSLLRYKTTRDEALDDNFRRGLLYTLEEYKGNSDWNPNFIRGVGSFMGEWGVLGNYNSLFANEIWTATKSISNTGLGPVRFYPLGLRQNGQVVFNTGGKKEGNSNIINMAIFNKRAICRGD
ncbi:hypothetical protein B6C84_11130 [Gilliamella apis]|nr:hypothetical protein B6C84_11130 [Gilliamella apis]